MSITYTHTLNAVYESPASCPIYSSAAVLCIVTVMIHMYTAFVNIYYVPPVFVSGTLISKQHLDTNEDEVRKTIMVCLRNASDRCFGRRRHGDGDSTSHSTGSQDVESSVK